MVHRILQAVMALILGVAVVLPLPTPARADPGDLDPTFGNNGKVVTVLGQRSITTLDTALQADGKIVAVGYSQPPSDFWQCGFVLARYNADGSPDRGFGDAGSVTPSFGHSWASGEAIALQPEGKIVVAGWVGEYGAHDFFLARFNPDGSLDMTFGSGGTVTTDFSGANDSGSALAIQTDRQIVVAGSSSNPPGYNANFAIARYDADGSLDAGFGEDGKVILDLGTGDDEVGDVAVQTGGKILVSGVTGDALVLVRLFPDGSRDASFGSDGAFTRDVSFSGNALEIQADGKIVVVGSGYTSYTGSIIGLARFSSAGLLDSTFGNQGLVITDFSPGSRRSDFGNDVVIQADGRIVAAGSTETASDEDFGVARYHPDGRLDTSFGDGGLITTDFAGRFDWGLSIALQPDGQIAVVGGTGASDSKSNSDFALVRYNADGSLDIGFGVAGRVRSNFELGRSGASDVATQSDGRTVVAGSACNGDQTGWDFVLARYRADGSLDPGFGGGGIVRTDFALGDDEAGGLVIQPDGRIVVSGRAEVAGGDTFALARYQIDGSLDLTFGQGGKVTTDLAAGNDSGNTLALQADAKILVVGIAEANGAHYSLARYSPDGSLDASFGTAGVVNLDFGSSWVGRPGVLVQPDQKIIMAGTGGTNDPDLALTRLNPDGSRDPSFGGGATVNTDFGGWDRGWAVAIRSDGRIITAGSIDAGYDFALACYRPDGSPDLAFGTGGKVTTTYRSGPPHDSTDWPSDVVIQADGKILMAGMTDAFDTGGDFALARYLQDGSLDLNFGGSGLVVTGFGSVTAYSPDEGRAIAIQGQGKIVMVGQAMGTFGLARYQGWDRALSIYLPTIAQTAAHQSGGSK